MPKLDQCHEQVVRALQKDGCVVIDVPDYNADHREHAGIVVMARVVGSIVIIDEDTTDRPLYKELMRAGIPREQIILAYAGEIAPETSSQENE